MFRTVLVYLFSCALNTPCRGVSCLCYKVRLNLIWERKHEFCVVIISFQLLLSHTANTGLCCSHRTGLTRKEEVTAVGPKITQSWRTSDDYVKWFGQRPHYSQKTIKKKNSNHHAYNYMCCRKPALTNICKLVTFLIKWHIYICKDLWGRKHSLFLKHLICYF